MATIRVSVSQFINAPPAEVYGVLSDYINHHPHILPKPYFTGLTVVQGGKGAGTVVIASMNVMGVKVDYHLTVTEPEPGRVLAESDEAAGTETTFTVDPVDGGGRSKVTIATEAATAPGFRGLMERLMNPGIMRKIYVAELKQLDEYMKANI